jgi:hypothetical protein
MRLLFINNDGGGFADHIELEDGTTVAKLFSEKVPKGKPQDYLIRVNRQPAAAEQVLHDGDRVSFTPVKIEGAFSY